MSTSTTKVRPESGRESAGAAGVAEMAAPDAQSVLVPRIREWCEAHSGQVRAAWLPFPPHEHLQAFVVTQTERYDFALSDDLSDLEMQLFQADLPCEVLQVPNVAMTSLRSFFDPEQSIQIYGNAAGTSAEG